MYNETTNQNYLKTNQTAGLETNLFLGLESRVMLRRNINIEKRLVNGALGTIVKIINNPAQIDYVFKLEIEFDLIDEIVTIERIEADYQFRKNHYVTRSQFPISLAWAITVHKCQGLSLDNVMIDLGSSIFEPGMAYVALSRARRLDQVHLIELDANVLRCAPEPIAEYNRLYEKFNTKNNIPNLNKQSIAAETHNKPKNATNIIPNKRSYHASKNAKLNKKIKTDSNKRNTEIEYIHNSAVFLENKISQTHLNNNVLVPSNTIHSNNNSTNAEFSNERQISTTNEHTNIQCLIDIYDPNKFVTYPLAFKNQNINTNSCYANVIIQVILHFGKEFFTIKHTFTSQYTR